MTTAERNIADRLQTLPRTILRENTAFVNQLTNWHDRTMTKGGAAMMLRLLSMYQKHIPDHATLRSAYINEQLNSLAP
jgi:hypothetical protein